MTVLTVTRHADGQVLHTGTDLPQALAVLDAAGHATATLTAAPCQPVPPPATRAEHDAHLAAGRLLDLAGRPLVARPCPSCPPGGTTTGETCPRSLPCPDCKARPGQDCRRASEHSTRDTHAARLAAATAADDAREAAGDPTLPRRWGAAEQPAAPVEPVAPPTSLAGAVEPLLPIDWPTPARVVGRGRTATVDLDSLALF